jgi:hypothetical protein
MSELETSSTGSATSTSTAASLAPADRENSALQAARQQVANLAERAKADPGVVFQADTLEALAHLRAQDPETWARSRRELQQAGISLRDVNAELHKRTRRPSLRIVRPDEVARSRDLSEPRTVGEAVADAPAWPRIC